MKHKDSEITNSNSSHIDFFLGLSFSNISKFHKFGAGVVGVLLLDSENLEKLRNIPKLESFPEKGTKDKLQPYVSKIHNSAEELEFIINKKRIEKPEVYIFDKYLNLIKRIKGRLNKSLLKFFSKIVCVEINNPYIGGFWKPRAEIPKDFQEKIKKLTPEAKILTSRDSPDSEFSILHLARICVRYKYLELKSKTPVFIHNQVRRTNNLFQIHRVKWNNSDIEEYTGFNVGYPRLIVHYKNEPFFSSIDLKLGKRILLKKIEKFCKGFSYTDVFGCENSNAQYPFGKIVYGSKELCFDCSSAHPERFCIFGVPQCDCVNLCENKVFAGTYCLQYHGLYAFQEKDQIRVGKSTLNRLLGRVLEHGAGEAVVIYPFSSLCKVSNIEKSLTSLLNHKFSFPKIGAQKASLRSISKEEKINEYKRNWEKTSNVLDNLIEFLKDRIHETTDISLAEVLTIKKINLLRNYKKPSDIELFEFNDSQSINGEIVGYRGTFLFLNTHEIIDLRNFYGYVVEVD